MTKEKRTMPTINLGNRNRRKRVSTTAKKAAQLIYQDRRWRPLREEKLRCNPLCERCEERGVSKFAKEVHHKIAFMSTADLALRDRLAFDFDNLRSLCVECHKLEERES